jgi:hypothetical membrane protein
MAVKSSSTVVHPTLVKWMIYLALIEFLAGIILAISVAYAFGGSRVGPGQFSIVNNYISDLGSHHYTLVPSIFDATMMATAILICPLLHAMHKLLLSNWAGQANEAATRHKFTRVLLAIGAALAVVGVAGFLGVGVFSEDRSTIGSFHQMHLIVSILVWGGLALASLFYGVVAMRIQCFIPRSLGFFMIVGPVLSVILFTTAAFILPEFIPSRPLEWLMLACAFWWMVPVGLILLRSMKNAGSRAG